MILLDGTLPEEKKWRILVLLNPTGRLGRAWQLGLALAQANQGQLLLANLITETSEEARYAAQMLLKTAQEFLPKELETTALLVRGQDPTQTLVELTQQAEVDLLLVHADGEMRFNLNRVGCAVVAWRGDREEVVGETAVADRSAIYKILLPTAGGPNTAHALTFLLSLGTDVQITVLYVVTGHQGADAEALGEARLSQLLDFVDGNCCVERKLVRADSIAEAIVQEANSDYDLVMLGASGQSSLDKALFGDVPSAVVRLSKRPIAIVRESRHPLTNLVARLAWRLQLLIPRLNGPDRTDAHMRIRHNARPDVDYYALMSLASMIASLGLIVDSPAVVIGAMLVAPLMSPILGVGLATVVGDGRFLKRSFGAVLQGVALGIMVGAIAGLLTLNGPLPNEILVRTQPGLIDLGIALFSGLVAAYAVCRSDAAGALPGVAIAAALVPPLATVGVTLTTAVATLFQNPVFSLAALLDNDAFRLPLGALLLFTTNFVAIATASSFMFLILGFRPATAQKEHKNTQKRAFRISLAFLFLVTALLAVSTYQLAQVESAQSRIYEVTEQQVQDVVGADLTDLQITSFQNRALQMDLIVRSSTPIPYGAVESLQENIGAILSDEGIIDTIALTMTIIEVTKLDPLVPPPVTPTPVATEIARPTALPAVSSPAADSSP
jgi:uncharacterized hydrophobic protein (TIGR00271 family)